MDTLLCLHCHIFGIPLTTATLTPFCIWYLLFRVLPALWVLGTPLVTLFVGYRWLSIPPNKRLRYTAWRGPHSDPTHTAGCSGEGSLPWSSLCPMLCLWEDYLFKLAVVPASHVLCSCRPSLSSCMPTTTTSFLWVLRYRLRGFACELAPRLYSPPCGIFMLWFLPLGEKTLCC